MKDGQPPRTHLFMVRIWRKDLGGSKTEWRRQVKYVFSGEVRLFRNWPAFTSHVQTMLENAIQVEFLHCDDRSE